jgi:hypothetical protein
MVIRLIGAYGRNYETVEKMINDWLDGKDFKIVGGPYCSVRDVELLKQDGYDKAQFFFGPHGQIATTIDL